MTYPSPLSQRSPWMTLMRLAQESTVGYLLMVGASTFFVRLASSSLALPATGGYFGTLI